MENKISQEKITNLINQNIILADKKKLTHLKTEQILLKIATGDVHDRAASVFTDLLREVLKLSRLYDAVRGFTECYSVENPHKLYAYT